MRTATIGAVLALGIVACSQTKRDFGSSDGGAGGEAGDTLTSGGTAGSAASGGSHAGGGKPGSSGSSSEAGSDSEAGSNSEAGSESGNGPLTIVSVTPDGATATTRDAISVTFSRAVTQASANAAIAISNGQGNVTGSLTIDGDVVHFTPRGSLCFDQKYTVSVADTVQTADATKLDKPGSFSFRIPDGTWQDGIAVGTPVANTTVPSVDLDLDGNAIAAWQEGSVVGVNYYDATKAAWNGVVRPTFDSQTPSMFNEVATKVRGTHAIALIVGWGTTETSNGKNWTQTSVDTFLGSSSYLGPAALAMTGDYSSALVWTDSHEGKPSSLWSGFHPAGAAWQAPTAAFVDPETYDFKVHELPDDSILAVYEHRLDQPTPGNVAARRYTKSKGWSSEKQIAAGGPPLLAVDSFGNALMTSGTTLAARYDYESDSWTTMPNIAVTDDVMEFNLALGGDGTAYAVYQGTTYTSTANGSVSDTHVGVQRLVGKKWNDEEIVMPHTGGNIALGGVTADDCGDLTVVWTDYDKNISYARRYTPNSGWLPTVTLTKVATYSSTDNIAGNAHGAVVVPYVSAEDGGNVAPRVKRFE